MKKSWLGNCFFCYNISGKEIFTFTEYVPPTIGTVTPEKVPVSGPTPGYPGTSAPTPITSSAPSLVPVTGKFDVYSVSGNGSK